MIHRHVPCAVETVVAGELEIAYVHILTVHGEIVACRAHFAQCDVFAFPEGFRGIGECGALHGHMLIAT